VCEVVDDSWGGGGRGMGDLWVGHQSGRKREMWVVRVFSSPNMLCYYNGFLGRWSPNPIGGSLGGRNREKMHLALCTYFTY
jgi:hypothetical protein